MTHKGIGTLTMWISSFLVLTLLECNDNGDRKPVCPHPNLLSSVRKGEVAAWLGWHRSGSDNLGLLLSV